MFPCAPMVGFKKVRALGHPRLRCRPECRRPRLGPVPIRSFYLSNTRSRVFPPLGVPLGINQDPEKTSGRSSKSKQSSLQRNPFSPNRDSKTHPPASALQATASGSTLQTTVKRKAFKVVATTPVRLFIPFVLGVLLTVSHNAPSRTCAATETYSALMSRIAASESTGTVGAISRLAVSALHTIAPILILLVIFIVP